MVVGVTGFSWPRPTFPVLQPCRGWLRRRLWRHRSAVSLVGSTWIESGPRLHRNRGRKKQLSLFLNFSGRSTLISAPEKLRMRYFGSLRGLYVVCVYTNEFSISAVLWKLMCKACIVIYCSALTRLIKRFYSARARYCVRNGTLAAFLASGRSVLGSLDIDSKTAAC